MPRFHVLLKTVVNVTVDIEAKTDREAAEKILDEKFLNLGELLFQDRSTWQSGVETSWDDGNKIEIEVCPVDKDDGPDYEQAQYFVEPIEPALYPENRTGRLCRVGYSRDDHTNETIELPDPKEK
jgi:hypothetical protein